MVIGVCKVLLSIDSAFSLKEKRQIIKSILGRVKSRFNTSIAEVDYNDSWKNTVIAAAYVSNNSKHAYSIMAKMVNFIESDTRAVLVDYTTEIMHFDNG